MKTEAIDTVRDVGDFEESVEYQNVVPQSLSQLQQRQFFKLGQPVVGVTLSEPLVFFALFLHMYFGQESVPVVIPVAVVKMIV